MLFLFKNICLQVTILSEILVCFACYRKMEVNSGTEVCFLCEKPVSADAVTVTRGLENLILVSKERKDKHHIFLEKQTSLQMHKDCRRLYILKRNGSFQCKNFVSDETKKLQQLCSPKKKERRSDGFDFRANCMFCGLPASKEHDKMRRRPGDEFVVIKKEEYHTKVITEIKNSIQNEFCKTLLDRISTVELVSAEARYHKKCNRRFFRPPPVYDNPGRPKEKHIQDKMAIVLAYIEKTDEKVYCLADLIKIAGERLKKH